ncbi:MAG: sodium-dependent transporter [Victivallaceae bacterium]|nr:sodium-dependent transporter [Victivallaceae bacterium]
MMEKREHWGSTFGFIMAGAGSAIGLGNIWKFPYITGINGGGAFVCVYLACIFFIGVPVLLSELALGRASQRGPIGAFGYFSRKSSILPKVIGGFGLGLSAALFAFGSNGLALMVGLIGIAFLVKGWSVAGFCCTAVAFLILCYYIIIGGWILRYAILAFAGKLSFATATDATGCFLGMAGDGWLSALLTIGFMVPCAGVCYFGVKKGIELASKIMMPVLLVIIFVLVIRSLTLPGASKGLEFFLKPDFTKLTTQGLLEALGHAFYSLSLGMATMITYGSYLPRQRNIFSAGLWIVLLDTCVALLAGIAIFPAVFAMGQSPAAGPGLIFNILPLTFNAIPGSLGWLWNGLFFLLMLIAALTSAISIFEPGVAALMEHAKFSRHKAVIVTAGSATVLGMVICSSVLTWERIPGVEALFQTLTGACRASLFEQIDYLCSSWVLPLNGFAIALFTGWIWGVSRASRELYRRGVPATTLERTEKIRSLFFMRLSVSFWSIFIRFIAPVLVLIMFLYAAGIVKFTK